MRKFLSDSALDWKVAVNRNTFDKSKKHFASYNFGKLYPMYCQHLQPNESLKIRPSMVFDLEPMTHELYNDVKCNTAWFKVNTRSLWSDYRKFARLDPTKSSNSIVSPFISRTSNFCTVGSLANHLGVPVTTYGTYLGNSFTSFGDDIVVNHPGRSEVNYQLSFFQPIVDIDFSTLRVVPGSTSSYKAISYPAVLDSSNSIPYVDIDESLTLNRYLTIGTVYANKTSAILLGSGLNNYVSDEFHVILPHIDRVSSGNTSALIQDIDVFLFAGSSINDAVIMASETFSFNNSLPVRSKYQRVNASSSYPSVIVPSGYPSDILLVKADYDFYFSTAFTKKVQQAQMSNSYVTLLFVPTSQSSTLYNNSSSSFSSTSYFAGQLIFDASDPDSIKYTVCSGFYGNPRYSSVSEVNQVISSPFVGSNPSLPLSALPFRAYRNIYNSHFRDKIHDPFRDSHGDIYVDQYVENLSSGADTSTSLDFEYCRFEPDLFNTCLPTPTMGDDVHRPLVGITVGSNPNQATLNYNLEGNAYSFDVNTHTEGSQTVIDGIAAVHGADNDVFTAMTLKDAIQYGISLQDLENVRALTKWYEASYRGKGRFEYDKFIEAHFGKQPSLKENLAAEYLGGDTVYINSMKVINQTSSSDSQPLGSTGGMANFQSKNDSISVFADEDCYIMGIVWFTVDNINSQSIDPMWFMSQPSDYGSPEFADLGVMPILNKVVAPLQCPSDKYNNVFGYQRMYGDKIYSFDTVAGDFLTLKSDYLMQRRFDDMPSLTAALSKMHPEDFTNIFCFDTSYDKIYGRWYFDVTISTWLQQTPNAQII